jgi:hypothetical protein
VRIGITFQLEIGITAANRSSFRHFERDYVDLMGVRIHVRCQDYVMTLVSFHCLWVGDGPALAVAVAYERFAVSAKFACDLGGLR